MKLKKDFFEKLLIYIFPIIIVIDIINRYMINNYMLYILNNIMYVGYGTAPKKLDKIFSYFCLVF